MIRKKIYKTTHTPTVMAGLNRHPLRTIVGWRIKSAMTGLFLFCFAINGFAQQAIITASMDTAQILIGEQTRVHLEIAADKTAKLQLPLITDTLMQGVEVVEISKIDTTDIGNNRIQIKYDYNITSFDENLYQLPPFRVVSGVDTFASQSLALKVSTIQVDTLHTDQFFDIKPVMEPDFVWKDYLSTALSILGGLLLVALIIYLVYRLKNQKPIIAIKRQPKVTLPPHVEAIQALDAIKFKKLWQQGKEKEYYSEVSDVVRNYIDRRFGVNAMEMTSGETLLAVRNISDVDFVFDNLKQMLFVSDMVKFAKYHPMPEENELSIGNAYLFVNSTIPVETPPLPVPTSRDTPLQSGEGKGVRTKNIEI